jgi:hypothetical protein
LAKVAIAVIIAVICAVAGIAFYRSATAPRLWQRPNVIVCPLREPEGKLDELRLACRRSLGLPSNGADPKQDRSVWVEQSGADLACVLDCVAQSKKDRAKSDY